MWVWKMESDSNVAKFLDLKWRNGCVGTFSSVKWVKFNNFTGISEVNLLQNFCHFLFALIKWALIDPCRTFCVVFIKTLLLLQEEP